MSVSSPSPGENLNSHPFFRKEFSLPTDDTLDSLVSARRMRSTLSPPGSSPSPTSPSILKGQPKSKRAKPKAKLDMAGLVGGDSDSSALTQESGDEGIAPTPRSTVTATDGGTDYAEDEDLDMLDASPGTCFTVAHVKYQC